MSGKRTKKSDKDRQHFLLSRRHLPRSSVRPFFCCGSQVSLNSIQDLKDFPVERDHEFQDDDYEDLTDSDEHGDEQETVQLNTTFTVENISKIDQGYKRGVRIAGSKHKKTPDKTNTRKKFWTLKLRGKLQVSKQSPHSSEVNLSSSRSSSELCVCTSYKTDSTNRDASDGATGGKELGTSDTVTFPVSLIAHVVPPPQAYASTSKSTEGASENRVSSSAPSSGATVEKALPFINLNELYPITDIDEQRIAQRQIEMERGIEVEQEGSGDLTKTTITEESDLPATGSAIVCSSSATGIVGPYPTYGAMGLLSTQSESLRSVIVPSSGELTAPTLSLNSIHWTSSVPDVSQLVTPGVHTQVDYKHYLVPDINRIVNSSFYWGVMDRYQAEKLIENKPEGTFLLRDSAQDEFLFSVSFRRYGRSLHARIEQWNHKFSFDSRDPGVFATDTVCGLIEHYLDPSCCMFFEPMLTRPLHRTFPFSLQHLSRAVVCNRLTYDGINKLTLPKTLKEYLRFYHYKQKVRVRRFDNVA